MNFSKLMLPLIFSVSLFGCSQAEQPTTETTTTETTAEATATQPTPQEEQAPEEFVSSLPDDAPVVKVSTEANYVPFEYKDEFGKVIGFDIDLIRAIGEHQGFKVEIYDDPWKQVLTNLEKGSRDMVAAGISNTEERREKYGVSDPYVITVAVVAYDTTKTTINSLEDLQDKKIGVLKGSITQEYFTSGDVAVAEVKEYNTIFLAVQALAQGKVDAVGGGSGVLDFTLSSFPEIQSETFAYEGVESAASQNIYLTQKGDTELLKQLNDGIKAVEADGTYAKLTEKWFGKDLTDILHENRAANAVE